MGRVAPTSIFVGRVGPKQVGVARSFDCPPFVGGALGLVFCGRDRGARIHSLMRILGAARSLILNVL